MATRSIGNENSKIGIIATPSVHRHRISGDDLALVAACDGVFDFMSNEEVAEIACKYRNPTRIVAVLKDEVLGVRAGSDNLTIIVVSLKKF